MEAGNKSQTQEPIERYIFNFKWDDTKFSRNNLGDMMKNTNQRVMLIDADLRISIASYAEKQNLLTTITKKDAGNVLTKDLADVLKNPIAKPEDFFYSTHFTTMICIVPKNQVENWEANYETFVDMIVPKSTKRFNYEDKDGYSLYRVILWKDIVQDFTEECKKYKIAVREFNFSAKASEDREKMKLGLKSETENLSAKLFEKCQTFFSELYQIYMHMKVLKLLVDCVMRFGLKEPIVCGIIKPLLGKEKKLHQSLTKLLADPKNLQMGLYGSKEEIDDTEDFYPYAFASLNIPQ